MSTTQQKQAAYFLENVVKGLLKKLQPLFYNPIFLSLESEESVSAFFHQNDGEKELKLFEKPTYKILCHKQKRNIKFNIFMVN